MTLDALARRYRVLPTELLKLDPAELRLVLDCAELGGARDRMRREAAATSGAMVVVVAGGGS